MLPRVIPPSNSSMRGQPALGAVFIDKNFTQECFSRRLAQFL